MSRRLFSRLYRSSAFSRSMARPAGSRQHQSQKPKLEALEDRTVPALASWTGGGGDYLWENSQNWAGDVLPGTGDDVVINTSGITITHASSDLVSVNSITSQANIDWQHGSLILAANSVIFGEFDNAGSLR